MIVATYFWSAGDKREVRLYLLIFQVREFFGHLDTKTIKKEKRNMFSPE